MKTKLKLISLLLIFSGISICGFGQINSVNNANLSENAPTDKSHHVETTEKQKEYEKMIAPYVAKARKTLPKEKKSTKISNRNK